MPGFVSNPMGNRPKKNVVARLLKDLSSFGMQYDDLVIRSSRAIGINEDQYGWQYDPTGAFNGDYDDYALFANLAMADTGLRKSISFFDKSYIKKREELRRFSVQDEIEDILDIICDDAIVVDSKGYFCYPLTMDDDNLAPDVLEKVKASMLSNFKRIYQYFGFNNDVAGWSFFRKLLIDGYLAFEIIYDNPEKPTRIIGFKELDPVNLQPGVDDKGTQVWVQFKDDPKKERKLYDSQIIYMSYSNMSAPGRVSYVERLIRAFNVLRIMEHTRVIWAVVNASYKTKFIIPVGGRSKTRAAQTLAVLMQRYKENIEFDTDSGELQVNGRAMMPFSKEYWLPEGDNGAPQIETMGNEGPDLSDTQALRYFRGKLNKVSKIPSQRFDSDNQPFWVVDPTQVKQDEMRFGYFINRLRDGFKEVLVKPLWLQMCLDHPELKEDATFKAQVGVRFNTTNHFLEMAEMEEKGKRIDFIERAKRAVVDQGPDMVERSFFSNRWLVERYLNMTDDDLRINAKYKAEEEKEMQKKAEENPNNPGNMGGGGF